MDGAEGTTTMTPFALEVSGDAGTPVLVVRGEIDVATSPDLRTQLNSLMARGAHDITLEFGGVSFVDSSGLGVLVGTYKRLREEGRGSIRIVGAQPSVRKVFEITGLEAALLDG
jgi:anti-sigma B factor antagonist